MLDKALFATHYFKAQQLYKDKLFKEAEGGFAKALEYNELDAKCRFKLGMCFFKQELWEEANIHISKAVELSPDNKDWKNQLTQVQRHLGRDIRSSATINKEDKTRKLLEYQPENASLYSDLAQTLNKQGKWWQEVDALKKAVEIDGSNASLFYRLGIAEESMNRFVEAATAIQQAIDLNKDNVAAQWYYRLGYNLEKSNQSRESIKKAYDKAIKSDKKLNAERYGIGVFHQQRGLWKEASLAYQSVREINPLDDELLYKLAMSYDRQYNWKQAKKYYKQAFLIKNNRPYTLYRLGFVNERMENYQEAVLAYEEAIRISKDIKKDWIYRKAYCLAKLGIFEEAASNYQLYFDFNAIKFNNSINPFINSIINNDMSDDVDFHNISDLYFVANTCFLNKDFKNSAKYFREYTRRSNDHNPEVFWKLGVSLYNLKYYKEACNAFSEMKIFKKAYEVSEKPLQSKPFKSHAIYTEYYLNHSIEEDLILYESYHGSSVSGNPYAIFRTLVNDERFKKYTHIWVLNDKDKAPKSLQSNPNVIFIIKNSDLYMRYLTKAKYLINNTTFPDWYIRKDDQVYLNTWHGTPLKTLGRDVKEDFFAHKNQTKNLLQASHIISPNKYTTEILLNSYGIKDIYRGVFAETGYPRQDLMIGISNQEKIKLKEELFINSTNRVVLYAPTWRGTVSDGGFDTEKLISDLAELQCLDNISILFRGHYMVEKILASLNLGLTIVPSHIDTNYLLSIVDVLVTDYSSICFDFIPMDRPIIYYTYDRKEYEEERGLYFPIEDLGGEIVYNIRDLKKTLRNTVSNYVVSEIQKKAKQLYCNYDDGKSTSRVIDLIFFNNSDQLNIITSSSKKSILLYGGPFLANGITTSFINLVNGIDEGRYTVTIVIDPNTVAADELRVDNLSKIKPHINIIARVGRLLQTIEDAFILGKFKREKNFIDLELWSLYENMHKREFKRVFGCAHFDYVINFEGYTSFWATLMGMKNQDVQSNAIYQHNDLYGEWILKYPYLENTFNLYKFYDRVVSVSEKTKEHNMNNLSRRFKIGEDKFIFADNVQNSKEIIAKAGCAIDVEDEKIFKGSRVFINIGRLSPEKGHIKLINAFSVLSKKYQNIKLINLGMGVQDNEIKSHIRKLRLENKVFYLGQKSNPYAYLNKADCFVLSSDHEGQPMTLFEAMILRKPIIATDIVGNRSVLEGRPGLLVGNSEEGLVRGMEDFLEGNYVETKEFDYEEYNKNALGMFYSRVCMKR